MGGVNVNDDERRRAKRPLTFDLRQGLVIADNY